MKDYAKIGEEIGKLVKIKNEQYGNAINNTGEMLKILYPNGIQVEDYHNVGVAIRILDKLFRISKGHTNDSWFDIAGYGILMTEVEDE